MFKLFSRYWSIPATISLGVETVLLSLAVWIGYRIRFWPSMDTAFFDTGLPLRALVFVAVVLLNLYFGGLYDFENRSSRRQAGVRLLRALSFSAVTLLVLYYVTYSILTTGRGVLLIAMLAATVLIGVWRLLLGGLLALDVFAEKILIIGSDEAAKQLAREVLARKNFGYRIVGFLADDPKLYGVSLVNPSVIGTTSQARDLALSHGVSKIVVAQQDLRGSLDLDSLLECKTSGVAVESGSDFYERITGKIMNLQRVRSWLVFSDGYVVSRVDRILKRTMDIVLSFTGLILSAPLWTPAAVAIKLDSRGPVLFRQERIGRHGVPFTLLKLRSMTTDAESGGEARWASENDPRVTRVGRFLRQTRLDELPQLWNVFVGQMSLVGPRPEREVFVDQLMELEALYKQRLAVRPGITGWAQIRSPYAASFEESTEKLRYDLYYIRNLSIFLDLSILASTARTVLLGRGAR